MEKLTEKLTVRLTAEQLQRLVMLSQRYQMPIASLARIGVRAVLDEDTFTAIRDKLFAVEPLD